MGPFNESNIRGFKQDVTAALQSMNLTKETADAIEYAVLMAVSVHFIQQLRPSDCT
jgi:hypothetical protein